MNRLNIFVLLVWVALAGVLKADAQPVTTIYSFINGPATPLAGLTLGNDGNFYGTTESGGLNNAGTLFKLTTNGITTTLVNFGATYSSGSNPYANLTLGPDGNFYGTTALGGTNHSGNNATGTVFRMTTNGTVTVLVNFNGLNGGIPLAGLTLGPDGNFYGTTEYGGTNGDGTVFKMTTNGTLTTLVNFNGTNGANPVASLTLGPGGRLYGTTDGGATGYGGTEYGGTNGNSGTVFEVTTNGTFATLFNFASTNGAQPYGAVTVGPDGNLYGTTSDGFYPNGAFDGGTIFELTTNGLLTTLAQLSGFFGSIYGTSNGVVPYAGLTLGPDGNFYGTTTGGGTNGTGTVFQVSTNGILAMLTHAGIPFQTYYNSFGVEFYSTNGGNTIAEVFNGTVTTLYTFSALINGINADGARPVAGLTLGLDGNFYGTASDGGTNGYGTVFKITTNGTFTTLATFSGNHGDNPMDALTVGPNGSLYGTANSGGMSGYGTVFKLTTGGALTTLVNFDRANDGAYPQAGLIVGPGGNFYGTAVGGGTNLLQTGPNSYQAESFGTVFELTTNGIFTTLAYFNGINGANPYGGLAVGTDGNLYGTTTYGGISNNGVVFRLLTNGTLTALTNFTGANGANPFAGLALGPDGNFYGTSEAGGTNGDGTVFQVTTNGTLTTLVYFNGTNGANPNAGLLLGPDGNFYGTAWDGGARNEGTVFKVTTGGTLTTLVNFAVPNGEFPVGGLALGPDGNFYGTTELGGVLPSSGTVFKLATNGTLTTLYSFNSTSNGNYPFAGLTLATNGNFIHFYGTTYEGPNGPSGGGGTVFQLNLTTAYAMPENSTNTFFPLTNEVLWTTGGTLSLVNAAATNGNAQITGSGIVFKPTANFIGTATINYAVTNNAGGTNASLITVLVTNVPPVANPDGYTVAENSSANVFSPLVNDQPVTSGGVLSLVSVSATNGTAVISGTNVLFTPQANFTGTATIGYTITDNVGGTNSSLITVIVTVANSISVVTITAPMSGQVVSNAAFTVSGTAAITGNPLATLTNVYVQLNSGGWSGATSVNGWTNWTANVTLTPGSNTVSAYAVDTYGNVSPTNSVTFDYVTNAGALFAGPPGTPVSNFNNPGGQHIVDSIGGGIGVQPITNNIGQYSANATAFAGDVVFLLNPNGGNNPTNWEAVLRFVNPGDPTGTNGLAATEYETYFQTNASPNTFAGFSLLPNVDYLPIASTNADGSITADAVVFGPVGAILAGQEATIVYTAAIQPSAGADLSLTASAAPEPVSVGSNLVYSITVSNAGPATATGMIVSNQLPANVSFVSATGGATPSSGVLLLNLGSLAAGATNSVQVVLQPAVDGQLTNTFQVSANEFDPNLTNNSATVVSTVENTFPVVPGTPLTYSGTWTNPGSSLFTSSSSVFGTGPLFYFPGSSNFVALTATPGDIVLLTDPTGGNSPTNWAAVARFFNPADPTGINGLTATESQAFFATNLGGSGFAGFQLFPNTDFIPAGSITTNNGVKYIVTTYTQFGPVGTFILAGQGDLNVLTVVSPFTDVSLSVAAAPQPVTVGSNLVYTLTVSNAFTGNAPDIVTATGVVISNQIPAGVTFISATGGATPANGVLLVNLGSLAEGTNTSVQVVVQPTAAGNLTNTFQVFANEFDPNLTNNAAAVVSTITNAAVINQGIPGTPVSTNWNPGGATVLLGEGGGIGVQPILYFSVPFTATPGDVVMLIDPNGGTNTSNWKAVVNFFNPSDPTGTNGLVATEYQTFFPTNAGPNYFANFPLFTSVAYVPIASTNADGSITANYEEYGPSAGGFYVGQKGIIILTASIQPSTGADLSLSASAAPEPVGVGSNLVYTLTVSNAFTGNAPDTVTATGVVISNQIPAGVTFVSATSGATPTNGMLLINLGSLAEGTNTSVQIVVQPTAAGSLTNNFQVFANELDPNLTNNSATVVSTVTNASPVNLADVSLNAGSIYATLQKSTGDWIYSFTVSNAGPSTATGVVVSNHIPTNVICGGQVFNANFISATGGATPTNDVLLLNVGTLAAGATNLVQVIESITQVGSSAVTNDGYMTNVFQVSADQTDPDPTNNAATFLAPFVLTAFTSSTETYDTNLTATVNQQATNYSTELIAKLPNGTVVYDQAFPVAYLNATVQSAITTAAGDLTNAGAASYTGPTETSFLQSLEGSSSVTVTNAIGTNMTSVTSVYIGPQTILVGTNQTQPFFIPAGAVDSDTFVTTVVTNLATTTDFSTNLNSAVYVMTGIVAQADLSLRASAAPEPVGVGSNLVYSIVVTNLGPSAATGVVVSNQVPVNVNFVSATGGATPASGVLLVNLGALTNGAVTNVQVIVQPTSAGQLTNLFQVFANETDPVLTNNSATVVSTVTNGPPPPVDVALSLTAAPDPVAVGAPLTYSLTVTNNSLTTATGVIVTDTLPVNVTLFSLLPTEGSASNHAGVVTYTVGSLPNGIAATLAIVVIPNAAGSLTNVAVASSTQTDSQPTNNAVTNVTTAVTVPITNLVLTVLSPITLNPQTGLFEQKVEVSNGGPSTPSSVMVLISGLAANATLYNATGITNGTPFVQSAAPLGIGSNVIFLLEFYVPTRVPPANLTYTVQAGPPVIPPVVSGTILSISRAIVLPNGNVLVEFSAIPGQVYAIQYSSDMVTWLTAVPAITAPANQVQWIDSGPPKTVSSPAQQGARYYRVILLTAK